MVAKRAQGNAEQGGLDSEEDVPLTQLHGAQLPAPAPLAQKTGKHRQGRRALPFLHFSLAFAPPSPFHLFLWEKPAAVGQALFLPRQETMGEKVRFQREKPNL